ncbi:hypothetical protein V8E53_012769 [Lactarius tabidus]
MAPSFVDPHLEEAVVLCGGVLFITHSLSHVPSLLMYRAMQCTGAHAAEQKVARHLLSVENMVENVNPRDDQFVTRRSLTPTRDFDDLVELSARICMPGTKRPCYLDTTRMVDVSSRGWPNLRASGPWPGHSTWITCLWHNREAAPAHIDKFRVQVWNRRSYRIASSSLKGMIPKLSRASGPKMVDEEIPSLPLRQLLLTALYAALPSHWHDHRTPGGVPNSPNYPHQSEKNSWIATGTGAATVPWRMVDIRAHKGVVVLAKRGLLVVRVKT